VAGDDEDGALFGPAAAGVTAGDRIFLAFSFGPFIGFWSAFAGAERLGALTISGGAMTTEQRIRNLRDVGATVLLATPTYALRMAELALGVRYPAPLLRAVERCNGDDEFVRRVGVQWATEQCRDLLDHQVNGIHFYKLNRSTATREIYASLGVKSSAGLRKAGDERAVALV